MIVVVEQCSQPATANQPLHCHNLPHKTKNWSWREAKNVKYKMKIEMAMKLETQWNREGTSSGDYNNSQ